MVISSYNTAKNIPFLLKVGGDKSIIKQKCPK